MEFEKEFAEFIHQVAAVQAQVSRDSAVAATAFLVHAVERAQVEGAAIAEMMKGVAAQVEEFQLRLAPIIARLAAELAELPGRQRIALRALAVRGWYLDPGLPSDSLSDLAEGLATENQEETEEELCNYFDSRCAELRDQLCKELPERARLLLSAFSAHARGDYAAAIPMFLIQADGVSQTITSVQLYSRKAGVPKLATKVNADVKDPLLLALLTPIIEANPISASADERKTSGDILNRHTVLHGESTDYDTRINSCRAMSLLSYVAWVMQIMESKSGDLR